MRYDFDEAGFNAAEGLGCVRDGDLARFVIRGYGYAAARIRDDGLIEVVERRSGEHRALHSALQATEAGIAAAERAKLPVDERESARERLIADRAEAALAAAVALAAEAEA